MRESPAPARSAPSTAGPYVVHGTSISLPVTVRDATSITAAYVVPTAAARRLVGHPALQLYEIVPGRAVCVLAAVEYRDNDLGAYNEFAVNFFVRHGQERPVPLFGLLSAFARRAVGAYVHWLPVTTQFSRDAGHDIWGFPKTVEDITFRDVGAGRKCTVVSNGQHVVTLSVRRGGSRRMPELPQDSFAWRDGELLRTPAVMSGEGVGLRLGGATLALGEHPRADELRSLGLPRAAVFSTWTERLQARFGAPQRVDR
jgi:hypothetical protein